MHSLLDEIVVTDENEEAFELIRTAMEKRDEPRNVWIYGPEGSGKTTAAGARARERDMLSTKKAVHAHAQEVMLFVELGEQGAPMLERLGNVGVVFLDSFDVFFEREFGAELAGLLLKERKRLGLDTIILSNKAPEEFDLTDLNGAADDFQRVRVECLDKQGCIKLAHVLYECDEEMPVLSDESLDYIGEKFASDPKGIRLSLRYLKDECGFEAGDELSHEKVVELLD